MSGPSRPAPHFDALEARVALSTASTAVPTLTLPEYIAARAGINVAVARLATTGNEARADAALVRAVRTVPDGSDLLSVLRSEVASADFTVRGSVRTERQQAWDNLDDFIQSGVESGDFAVAGRFLQRRFAPTVAGGGTTPTTGGDTSPTSGGTTSPTSGGTTTPTAGGGTAPIAGQSTVINFMAYNQARRTITLSLTQANNPNFYSSTINTSTPVNGFLLANPTPTVLATATSSGFGTAYAPVPLGTTSIVVAVSTTNPTQLTITTYT